MRRWDGLVDRYIHECESRGLAQGTVKRTRSELCRFGTWLKQRRPKPRLEQVDSELVVRYISGRSAFRSRSTVSGVVSQLRSMGEFLVREGVWTHNSLRWLRGPKCDNRRCLPKRIDRAHLKALWSAAESRRQEYARYQAVCVLAVLYGTGMRSGELLRLDLDDWDADNATVRVDGRKTGHARSAVVGEGVWRCIEAYLPRRQNQLEKTGHLGESSLLVNRNGERMSAASLLTMMKRLAAAAGVPPVTIHQFRHSCASDLLEAGVSLPEVQQMLGHRSITSTMRYVDIADPERAAAIAKHPVNAFLGSSAEEVTP